MPEEKITFTEKGKVRGTSGALLEIWKKREELQSIKMEHIPLCG